MMVRLLGDRCQRERVLADCCMSIEPLTSFLAAQAALAMHPTGLATAEKTAWLAPVNIAASGHIQPVR